jgi:hypothetical protein
MTTREEARVIATHLQIRSNNAIQTWQFLEELGFPVSDPIMKSTDPNAVKRQYYKSIEGSHARDTADWRWNQLLEESLEQTIDFMAIVAIYEAALKHHPVRRAAVKKLVQLYGRSQPTV